MRRSTRKPRALETAGQEGSEKAGRGRKGGGEKGGGERMERERGGEEEREGEAGGGEGVDKGSNPLYGDDIEHKLITSSLSLPYKRRLLFATPRTTPPPCCPALPPHAIEY